MRQEGPAPPKQRPRRTNLRQYLSLSALGIEIGVAVAIGLLVGWYLDRLFGTEPWLLIAFSIFGIVAGFRNVIVLARKEFDKYSESDHDDGSGGKE